MARPRYETKADRKREAKAITVLENRLGLRAEKMPQGHRADFSMHDTDDRIVGYVEVKTRTCNHNTYETYHVSKDKLLALQNFADREGKRAGLLVQWKDRTGFISVGRFLNNATFKKGGRWDRGDKFDVELMADIDINHFTFID
jgi:hypothetical protein